MIKCLAVDDEPLALQQLAAYIKKVPFLELVGECPSAIDAKKLLDEEMVDAIFCDINMPDLNGMDFVKGLAAPPLVVFTTAYAEFAVEGYKVNAVDYLLKPFGLDDFRRAADRLQARLKNNRTSPALPRRRGVAEARGATSLFVKTDGRIVKINTGEISYVEGMSEYLKIHFDGTGPDGKPPKPLVILFSMKNLEERLPDNFMRIHRSYLINLWKIQEVNKNRVIMNEETYLPIGDLYREAFNNYISNNFLGK